MNKISRSLNKLFWSIPKCKLNSANVAKQIRDNWERAAFHIFEEQNLSVVFDHSSVNLGEFEIRIDYSIDFLNFATGAQGIYEFTKISH